MLPLRKTRVEMDCIENAVKFTIDFKVYVQESRANELWVRQKIDQEVFNALVEVDFEVRDKLAAVLMQARGDDHRVNAVLDRLVELISGGA